MSRLSKAELRRAIEKEQSEYNPEDLFGNPAMQEILESIITGACEKLGRHPNLFISCEPTSEFTAATDGLAVMQNTMGPLIRELKTNWEKYVSNVGHTVHESGHVLFTNFLEMTQMRTAWETGKFYPVDPAGAEEFKKAFDGKPNALKLYTSIMMGIENTIEDAYIENLLRVTFSGVAVQGIALVNKEIYRKMGTKEDVICNRKENKLPPIAIAEALLLSRLVCGKELPDGNLSEAEKEELTFVESILATAESEIKELLWEQDGETRAQLYNEVFVKFLPLFPIDKLMEQDAASGGASSGEGGKGESAEGQSGQAGQGSQPGDSSQQAGGKGGNTITICVQQQAEGSEASGENDAADTSSTEDAKKQESDGSESKGKEGTNTAKDSAEKNPKEGDASSSGKDAADEKEKAAAGGKKNSAAPTPETKDISEKELQRAVASVKRREKEIGKSEILNSSSVLENVKIEVDEKAKEKANDKAALADNADVVNGNLALSRAIKAVCENRVFSKDEKDHEKELRQEMKDIHNHAMLAIGNYGFTGYSLSRPNPGSVLDYTAIYKRVEKTSRNLTRKINNIMREREVESVDSGFMMGQRFNARDIVNRDGKYFSRQSIPDGKITTAFGILVDESGSMQRGMKKERAKRVAILIEDVLRSLDVPLIVTGHTAEVGVSRLHCYKDFDTRDGKDHLRLVNIMAQGGNIDGAAITYVGEKLLKRPENKKVLIVISDGAPAGHSFFSTNNYEDTSLAAKYYRKKGVEVFGAILDDVDSVSNIYGKDYCFDCRNDGELERQLVRLIKKYVLMKG